MTTPRELPPSVRGPRAAKYSPRVAGDATTLPKKVRSAAGLTWTVVGTQRRGAYTFALIQKRDAKGGLIETITGNTVAYWREYVEGQIESGRLTIVGR